MALRRAFLAGGGTPMKISICIAAIALAATAAAADETAPAYTVRTLPTLGGGAAGASSINQAGWISGLSTLAGDEVMHAALWVRGETIDLGALGGPAVNSGV